MKKIKYLLMLSMLTTFLFACRAETVSEIEETVEESVQISIVEELSENDDMVLNDEEVFEETKISLMVEDGKCDVGNTCIMGTYQMDEQAGEESIEWLIVKEEGGKLLLVSKYLLPNAKEFNDVINNYTTTYWDACSLRQWLNDSFYNNAFSSEEKSIIVYSQVGDYDLRLGGENSYVYDNIFIPSKEEVYLLEDAKATHYNSDASLSWWIRTTGEGENATGLYTAFVNANGGIDTDGSYNYRLFAVRPSMWIDSNMCEVVTWEVPEADTVIAEEMSQEVLQDVLQEEMSEVIEVLPVGIEAGEVGDIVTFGRYEQDSDASNGAEPLEWIILDKQDGKALLLCDSIIDGKYYHYEMVDITWENCGIRNWLNQNFYEEAFTVEEQETIILSMLESDNSPRKEISGGNSTEDKVFCMSLTEVNAYVPQEYLGCEITEYAQNQGVTPDSMYACWYLRTPGNFGSYVCCVDKAGKISEIGTTVISNHGVRPAIWVTLKE